MGCEGGGVWWRHEFFLNGAILLFAIKLTNLKKGIKVMAFKQQLAIFIFGVTEISSLSFHDTTERFSKFKLHIYGCL